MRAGRRERSPRSKGRERFIECITLGTRKKGFSASGAAASTALAISQGRGVSSRNSGLGIVSIRCTSVQHLRPWLKTLLMSSLLEFLDVAENAVELATIGVHFLGREPQMGQFSNSQHFLAANFHLI